MNYMSFTEYMSFDLGWFTTPAGILITVGLVLFLVGFICYILSGKKDKKEEAVNAEEKTVENAAPATDANAATEAAQPVVEATPEVAPVVEEKVEEVVTTEQVEVPSVTPEVPAAPEAAPVETPTEVVVPTVENPAPVVENLEDTPVTPEVVLEVPAAVVAEEVQPAVEVATTEPEKVEEAAPAIYGGANPSVTIDANEEPKQVYGGADPLENTGALPRVEIPSEPVSQPTEEVLEAPVAQESSPAVENTTPVVEEEKKEVKPAPSTDDVETLEF